MENQMNKATEVYFTIWIIPIIMLFVALLDLPYGYYTLLRIIVCGCSGYLAFTAYNVSQKATLWVFILGGIALLFNPIIPIHLSKELWTIIDPIVAFIFVGHFIMLYRERNNIKTNTEVKNKETL